MKTIYKYRLPYEQSNEFSIVMPENARILHVGMQGAGAYVWALVDTNRTPVPTMFEVYGTGEKIEPGTGGLDYVGTFMPNDGALVFHVFRI